MTVKHAVLACMLAGSLAPMRAQVDSVALRYAATISQDDLREHLRILSSDAYQGRDTGKEGQKMAAEYLREQFMDMGIPPVPVAEDKVVQGYYQPFPLIEERSGSISIEKGDRTLEFMRELVYFNEFMRTDRQVNEVLFLGDGRAMEDMKAGDVIAIVDDGEGAMVPFMASLQAAAEQARAANVEVMLVATPRVEELVKELGHFITGSKMRLASGREEKPRTGMQTILVEKEAATVLFSRKRRPARIDRLKQGRRIPVEFTIKATPAIQEIVSENVLAYIEGTDKKDEVVILTAHYDHIGVEGDEIYNGADDDGSGTVALIEIAEAFAKAKAQGNGPRRSILVMPVSGEEKGLLGSRYYSDNPVFPIENTVADLNIDMIGRTDSAHAGGGPYVYVIGSDRLSSELHRINEEANTNYTRLELDYTFNAPDDPNKFYYRSDHYNFARKGIPSIFYFSGVHEDYHQPTDTEEKIQYDRLHQRTLLVFHTAWILANREERIVVDKPVE